MSELEEKLTSLLSNPQLIQQIMSMAQSINTEDNCQCHSVEPQVQNPQLQMPDPALLQSISQKLNGTGVDHAQQELLQALSPFLSTGRIQKLEKAMRAAKMAGITSFFLNSSGLKLFTGR